LNGKITTCWAAACESVPREQCEDDSQRIRRVHGADALFLYVAADWPHKNHALLIDAAMRLRPHRRFTVVFIGPRRTDRLRRLIEERHAGDRVVDLGPVSRTVLAAYYYAATCLVYPSLDEGFGIPLVEAMKCGTPIVASDAASIPEVCGDSAVLLPPADADSWAEEMCRMMDDGEHRTRRSRAVLGRGRLFSWERSWQSIDRVLSATVS
jgi:glycosyltransferase involved in cell wall biosynthesis